MTPQTSLDEQAQAAWDANAAWWDDYVGPEGHLFHRAVIAPATERFLEVRQGDLVLDIACGNGQFSRRLADLGARVLAFDAAETFIARARGHSSNYVNSISYQRLDAANAEALLGLGRGRFDAAVCNMALMDIPNIEPLAAALPFLLKPGGRFVFSVTHPCFNSGEFRRVIEEEDRDGTLVASYAVKIHSYAQPTVTRGIGIIGQPQPHLYFHRPLGLLLSIFFAQGLTLDALAEPTAPPDPQSNRPFSWSNFSQIPPVLVARLRTPTAPQLNA